MSLREDLIEAKEMIADPNDWGKGDADGLLPFQGCNCAWTACLLVPDSDEITVAALVALLPPQFIGTGKQPFEPLIAYNDAPTTTHADIMALFDRAIAAAS